MLVKMDVLEEFLSSCSKRAGCADTLRVIQLRIFFTNLKLMHLHWQLYLYSYCLHLGMAPLVIGVYGMIWGSGAYLIPPYSVSSRPANTFTLQPLNLTFLLMIMLHVECPFCALQKQFRRN